MRILFIGNSHTFANGLPYQTRELVRAAGGRCETWMVAPGGQSLAWHAAEAGTHLNITCNRWDRIVLQQNTHPFSGYRQLAADFAGLKPSLDAAGAGVILYVTWKKKDAPQSDQAELNEAFRRLAREQGATLAPVGPAWAIARVERPDIELYDADGAHASPAGTFLGACVFRRVLVGPLPAGAAATVPHRIVAGATVLANLPPAHAAALASIADRSVEQFTV